MPAVPMLDKERIRRDQFPVTERLIYLNHAAVGPLSRRAFAAMQRLAEDQMNFGAAHWREWYAEYERLREIAGRMINAAPSEISILKNTSEGLSFVAEGYHWEAGDNVITTDLEFPSNFTPWRALEHRGVECRVVESRDGGFTTADVERLIDGRTRIVSVSSTAFHNGFTADLKSLGALCRERGVLLCVDAIQSLGAIPIDVRAANISFLSADGHKWMLGPEGAALFFCSEEGRSHLRVIEYGWTNVRRKLSYLRQSTDLMPDSRRFEAGSLNTTGIFGLRAALELQEEIGREAIAAEVVRIATDLCDRLETAGLEVRSPRPIGSGIVAAAPRSVEAPTIIELHRFLETSGVICSPREGTLRFSPHFYNTEEENQRVADLLAARLR